MDCIFRWIVGVIACINLILPAPTARAAAPKYPASPVPQSPALAQAAASGALGFNQFLVIQRHHIDSSHVYTYHTEGFRAGGGLFICALGEKPQRKPLVDSPQGQILDLDLSYDGAEVLFAWKQNAADSYHLYTIKTDGTGLKQLTDGPWHDYNGCYLPDGGIAFLSTRSARFAYCWVSPVGLLHRMERDRTTVTRLSANIVNDFTPSVLDDGRLIYSRWEYVDRPAIPIQGLWTINPDGTALAGFYGNRVLSPATLMEARSIPGTTKVLCLLTSHNGPARGAIGIVERSRGDNTQEALSNITPEIKVDKVNVGSGNNIRGPYDTAFPLSQKHFMVSRDGAIIVRDYSGTEEAEILPPQNRIGFHNAIPLTSRKMLPTIPSMLPAQHLGQWATVFVQDVYLGLEPHVKRGEVRQIAVIQEMEKTLRIDLKNRAFDFQFPVISCGATYAGKKVFGFAPVEADGSACFKVPAGIPIYFLALDEHGRAVQRMRTFTHLMPGEVQGCIGCHESRTQASPPRRPAVSVGAPVELHRPAWLAEGGFDYCKTVQPVLDQHCVKCHSAADPQGKVDLSADKTDYFNVSYETLARGRKGRGDVTWDSPYVNWIPTYNGHEQNILQITPKFWGSPKSRLADLIMDGHPDKEGKARVSLSSDEKRAVFLWIDLNIPYYGTSETAYPDNKGARRMYPANLDKTLATVAAKRCVSCHTREVPRPVWTRITNPRFNGFLTAPLAKSAGGTEACKKVIFESADDPDYQAILKTFDPVIAQLKAKPRDDMPGAKPETNVDRRCR